ncbi:uncharacterized protein JCM15063_006328 [Sporobolomyces koalae]|uniref:uncharacterized protein n=1 Tax=Sporobolomyces koalae TaxID=500713 RepID=UPI003181D858
MSAEWDVFSSSTLNHSTSRSRSRSRSPRSSLPWLPLSTNHAIDKAGSSEVSNRSGQMLSFARDTVDLRDEREQPVEYSKISPFLTPPHSSPHVLQSVSKLSPPESDVSLSSTAWSFVGSGILSPPSSSPPASLPRSKLVRRYDPLGSSSLPITPLRPNLAAVSLFSPIRDARDSSQSATWPPRCFHDDQSSTNASSIWQDAPTPTKQGKALSRPLVHADRRALATRYVVIEGLDSNIEGDAVHAACTQICGCLSLRSCIKSHIASHGFVVLAFHDVRDAVSAVRLLTEHNQHESLSPRIFPRCISREEVQELLDCTTVLSESEGVIVFSVQGSTSSVPFSPLPLLSIYGAVRSATLTEERVHVVEFFDDRAAEKACRALNGATRGGFCCHCTFEANATATEPPQANVETRSCSVPSSDVRVFSPFSPAPSPIPFSDWNEFEGSPFPMAQYADSASTFSYHERPLSPAESPVARSFKPHVTTLPRAPLSPPLSPAVWTGTFTSPLARPTSPIFSTFSFASSASSPFQHAAASPRLPAQRLPPNFGIVRDDKIPLGNVINYERIEQGFEVRTTLMLKNIPNKLKDFEVMRFVEEAVGRSFDFFYLRADYATGCNVGYGFVNFTSMASLLSFCKQRLGTRWNLCNSDKLCVLSFANIQGKDALINHFKNSSVLDQDESRRPKLFVTSGPNAGQPEKFPMCDDPVRKMRSALNAAHVGLFPSHKPVFKIASAFQGMNL